MMTFLTFAMAGAVGTHILATGGLFNVKVPPPWAYGFMWAVAFLALLPKHMDGISFLAVLTVATVFSLSWVPDRLIDGGGTLPQPLQVFAKDIAHHLQGGPADEQATLYAVLCGMRYTASTTVVALTMAVENVVGHVPINGWWWYFGVGILAAPLYMVIQRALPKEKVWPVLQPAVGALLTAPLPFLV